MPTYKDIGRTKNQVQIGFDTCVKGFSLAIKIGVYNKTSVYRDGAIRNVAIKR